MNGVVESEKNAQMEVGRQLLFAAVGAGGGSKLIALDG